MTKCAQFPFHIWLMDTMETPTPVSALMHAGVINAGGILLTRVSSSLVTFQSLNYLILLIGLVSTFLSIHWMNNQPDTKKKLAYSTMGQMGYMLAQCSLGAFPAAIFHLMSHGFYKASLFLNSGETLSDAQQHNFQSVCYKSIIKSFVIGSGIFCAAYFLLKNETINAPLLLYGFITLTLVTIIYKIQLSINQSLAMRISGYVMVFLILIFYLYCFHLFSSFLLTYEYTSTISIASQITLLSILIILQLVLWVKKAKWPHTPFKDHTELFLRNRLLNSLRYAGNVINQHNHNNMTKVSYIIFISFTLMCFIFGLTYNRDLLNHYIHIDNVLIFCFLIIGIISLILANRCNSISLLINFLILFELAFMNIALFDGNNDITKVGVFHLINIIPVLLMLYLLARNKSQGQIVVTNNNSNRFPARVFYLTFALLLLIGIPGTASFISEFYLLNALVDHNVLFILMYLSLIILIAIVIMHSLQLYVFNKNYTVLLSKSINKRDHIIFIGVIGLNILCGIFPRILLNHF